MVTSAPASPPDSAPAPQTSSEYVVWLLASAQLCMDLKWNLNIYTCVCVCTYICRLFGTLELKGQVGGDSLAVSLSLGFLMAQRVKYLLAIRGDLGSIPRWGRSPGEGNGNPLFWGFCGGSEGKASACNVGDPGLIPGSGISPREGNGNPLQYSYLENSMKEPCRLLFMGITKSWTWLSNFTSHEAGGLPLLMGKSPDNMLHLIR